MVCHLDFFQKKQNKESTNKNVLPNHMKLSSNKNDISDTYCTWQRRLNTRAPEAVTKGNTNMRTHDLGSNTSMHRLKRLTKS